MTVIILAQGAQERFPHRYPKQFVDVLGEPLIARTLRAVRDEVPGADVIVVAAAEPAWQKMCADFGAELVTLEAPGRTVLDGLWQTRPYWAETTRFLLGDVVFSRAAMTAALKTEVPLYFVGRHGQNRITKCPWGELFALGTTGDVLAGLHASGKLWRLWASLRERAEFYEIDDYTDDVDDARDLSSLPALCAAAKADDARR